jgi:hypothetical protein
MPVRQRKRNGGTSTSTSTTSIASASTGRYEVPTRAQALPTRYDQPDSLYTSELDRNMSQASTLSTRAEQLAFDDFSNGDLLPEFIETTRQIHLEQQQLPHQSMLSERMTHRPNSASCLAFNDDKRRIKGGTNPLHGQDRSDFPKTLGPNTILLVVFLRIVMFPTKPRNPNLL